MEASRQLIQELVAPKISALEARIDAAGKKFESLAARMEKRLDAMDAKMERDQNQIMDTLHRMESYHQLAEQIVKVEGKLQQAA